MSWDTKTDRIILMKGASGIDKGLSWDEIAKRINESLKKHYSATSLRKRFDILRRQNFTGKLIPDEKPSAGENTVTIPAKIIHKYDLKKPETFSDLDRLTVHMHNNIAMLVEVMKEMSQTLRNLTEVEINRADVEKIRMDIQKQQLEIQRALYQKTMEKK